MPEETTVGLSGDEVDVLIGSIMCPLFLRHRKSRWTADITGDVGDSWGKHTGASGAFSLGTKSNRNTYGNADVRSASDTFAFDASKSNAIYGKSSTVQPPALTLLPIIKAL